MGFDEWCSKSVPSIPVLGSSHVIGAVFTDLCAVPAAILDALTECVSWLFALDHTNYARWITVHLCNITELPMRHPDVTREFNEFHASEDQPGLPGNPRRSST